MTMTPSGTADSDAILTAYLDNELDPEAREEVERLIRADSRTKSRLAELAGGCRGIHSAFDQMLEAAPVERLEARLAAVAERVPAPPMLPSRYPAQRGLLALVASVLLAIGGAAGFLAGQAPPPFIARLFASDEWQETVARQVSLYSPASLEAIRVDQVEQRTRLDRLAETLNLRLSADTLALPGLTLKRVEQLQIEGRPLAQLLYASDDIGPIALCILRESEADTARETKQVAGMTLIYWTADAHGFLLVGTAPVEKMQELAETTAQHFSG